MASQLNCLGDSLTFGLGVPYELRWTTMRGRRSCWQAVNLGICGDTTGGMLSRLAADVLPQLRGKHPASSPTLIFIMGGSNDILYSLSQREARANLGAMVHQVKSGGFIPVVGIPPSVEPVSAVRHWGNDVADFSECAGLLVEYGRWLSRFCRAFHVPCVDFRPIFALPDGSAAAERFLDGIHPSPESHKKMAAALLAVLEECSAHMPWLEELP